MTDKAETAEDEDSDLSGELTRIGRGYLTVVSIALGLYFLRRGFEYFYTYPEPASLILGWTAFATSAYAVLIIVLRWRNMLADRWVQPLLTTYGFALIFNVYANVYLMRQPEQLYNASFIMIIIGLANVSFRSWLLQIVVSLICFFAATVYLGYTDSFKILPMLAGGLGISIVAYFTRVPVLKARLRLENRLARETEKLKAANAAKDRFLANMTHELRTPMTGVLGMLDLMESTRLDAEQRDLLTTAQSSARYLLAVINDILDFSKLEAGKIELKPEAVDPVGLTEDIVSLFRGQASAKGIALELDLPEDGRFLSLDPVRVSQVLLNLISNAVKYTPKGRVLIRLRYADRVVAPVLVWEICDTGMGIPADMVGRLFERFEQLDSSSARQQGTGLGLAIIRELVALMGGRIEVESELGVGSVFRFQAPLVAATAPAPEVRETAKPAPSALAARSLHILVAEDNPINQRLVQKILEGEGWAVTLVGNGAEAVSMVLDGAAVFDIILMDVQMPVMDGVTATRMLLDQMEACPPILALTANTMEKDVDTYLEAGMAGCIGKPIDRAHLYHMIAEALAGAVARPAATVLLDSVSPRA